MKRGILGGCSIALLFLAGCSGRKVVEQQPPALPPSQPAEIASETPAESKPPGPPTPKVTNASVLYSETGIASWYGAPYHNRRGANGQIYDMNAFTAAHKTLPLNSLVRVTNLKTGRSATVRITDRGPFIGDRIIDLSLAAAKEVDVWLPGTALVKLDVLDAPSSIERGGRWAVQIGAFQKATTAAAMKSTLLRRYHTVQVLQFTGPTGEWVRIRVPEDDKRRAQEIAKATVTPEGGIFLVRLD